MPEFWGDKASNVCSTSGGGQRNYDREQHYNKGRTIVLFVHGLFLFILFFHPMHFH